MNLATILYKKGPKNKKVFLYFNQQEYTFEDAEKRSSSIANYLQANGIKPDDKVAIISGNRPEFIFSYFGILKVGGIVVPVNPLLTPSNFHTSWNTRIQSLLSMMIS
ncbi:MAG: AMP-binding protein [Candidatus Hydrothermae bacterium]|nr:AMP-binding protein [Candidatus Hydrothermae bacterium]